MTRTSLILVVAVALAVAGCLASAPRGRPSRSSSPVARAQAAHEYPSPQPRRQPVAGAWRSAPAAVDAFASAYINWDAGSVSADMRGLAARSIGQARAATQLAAAQTADDYELQRGGIANHGTVVAITRLPGNRGEYVVVTRELTTATATTAYQGLRPAWHVAIAAVAEVARGWWVVSAWEPQS